MDTDEDVIGAVEFEHLQRLIDDLLVNLVGEEVLERAPVDRPLAGARDDAHAAIGSVCGGPCRRHSGPGGFGRAGSPETGPSDSGGVFGQLDVVVECMVVSVTA